MWLPKGRPWFWIEEAEAFGEKFFSECVKQGVRVKTVEERKKIYLFSFSLDKSETLYKKGRVHIGEPIA